MGAAVAHFQPAGWARSEAKLITFFSFILAAILGGI
jgi:hypothetical protein